MFLSGVFLLLFVNKVTNLKQKVCELLCDLALGYLRLKVQANNSSITSIVALCKPGSRVVAFHDDTIPSDLS